MLSVTVLLWVFFPHMHASRLCTNIHQRRYNSLDLAKEYIKGHNILFAYIHIMLYSSSGSSQFKRSGQLTGLVVPTCNLWSEDEVAFFADIQRLLNSIGE